MKSKNTNGFTLVELIIVITILAILATIAFISFQSYTKDARNSKRSSDLSSISNAIEVKMAEGVEIMKFASGTSTNTLSSIDLAGSGSLDDTTQYVGGELNTTIIGATNNDSFQDPQKKVGYKIGVTTLAGGAYQIAAIKEVDNGSEAMVVGTFKSRSGSTASGTVNDDKLSLETGLGLFKKGDILTDGTHTATIDSVSSDLSTITLSNTTFSSVSGNVFKLDADGSETVGLIKSTGGTAVENGGTALPY